MLRKQIGQNNLLKNVSWTFIAKIVAMIFAFMLDILLARILGVDDYAEWTFFYTTVTMMFYLTWFGINSSVKVLVSKQTTDLDTSVCIRAGLILRTLVSLIFSVVVMACSKQIAIIFGYPEKYSNLLFLYKCAGTMMFLNSFAEFFKELNIGLQKYRNLFWVTLNEFGWNFLLGTLGACLMKNVIGVACGYIVSGIIVLFVGYFGIGKMQYDRKRAGTKYREMLKEIFRYALPLAVTGIGGMILTEMDTFMLGIISTKQQVSIYSIAKQLCSKAAHINYALATGTLTSLSVINAANRQVKEAELKRISKVNLLITGFVAAGFIIAGPFAINILYGNAYQGAGTIVVWLVPYYILYSISTFFSMFLDFQGRAGVRSMCYCLVLVINFILNCMLIPKYGAVGASIATGMSLLPYALIVVIITVQIIGSKVDST